MEPHPQYILTANWPFIFKDVPLLSLKMCIGYVETYILLKNKQNKQKKNDKCT